VWEEIREDENGLYERGRLSGEVEQARDVRALLADEALNGLSIGFRTMRASRQGAKARTLLEVDPRVLSGCSTPPPAAVIPAMFAPHRPRPA
jgi:HK97 family phage prohead protease